MLNALEAINSNPTARIFDIEGLLFAQFNCPKQENPVGLWSQTDHLLHVLSGKTTWKTLNGTFSAGEGESVFFKKGAYIMPEHFEEHLCVEVFFIPDPFVRETVRELAPHLPALYERIDLGESTIRVNNDVALSAFFHGMTIYFADAEKPPETLLKLKLKELLASILMSKSNPVLSAYFRSIAASEAPEISGIMETSFYQNLPIETFAQMCHRSVSSFKREFRTLYGTSPGKWLLERRLKHSASLLQSTSMSVTDVALECGFESLSHFSRVFKGKFGRTPSAYRETATPDLASPAIRS